ncbi:MAG: gamma-glutamylcyclotransferase [Pseudomonadota bacterium]
MSKPAVQPPNEGNKHWVFAYGSLIHKIDFPFLQREVASLRGWTRRFWQGSHDHRGTPEAPGRVLTLIPDQDQLCRGVAYLIEEEVFAHLDYREKNGYARVFESIVLEESRRTVNATVYVADQENPAFLGDAEPEELAQHIATAQGPSGLNRDYLLDVARALKGIGERDAHVEELANLVRGL